MTLLIRHSVTPVYSYAPRGETPVNLPAHWTRLSLNRKIVENFGPFCP